MAPAWLFQLHSARTPTLPLLAVGPGTLNSERHPCLPSCLLYSRVRLACSFKCPLTICLAQFFWLFSRISPAPVHTQSPRNTWS